MKMKEIDIVSADKLKHYEKGTYSGGHKGMRYFICSQKQEESLFLSLCIWPEPYCFAAAKEEEKMFFLFPFTDKGLEELEEKVNQLYEEKKDYWNERAGISTLNM